MSTTGAPGTATVAQLLSRCLRAVGATRAFRAAGPDVVRVPGLPAVDVPDPKLAALLADADGRLARAPAAGPGVALLPGGRIRISAQPHEVVLALPVHGCRDAAVGGGELEPGWGARRRRARPRPRPGRPRANRPRTAHRGGGGGPPRRPLALDGVARHGDRGGARRGARRPGGRRGRGRPPHRCPRGGDAGGPRRPARRPPLLAGGGGPPGRRRHPGRPGERRAGDRRRPGRAGGSRCRAARRPRAGGGAVAPGADGHAVVGAGAACPGAGRAAGARRRPSGRRRSCLPRDAAAPRPGGRRPGRGAGSDRAGPGRPRARRSVADTRPW